MNKCILCTFVKMVIAGLWNNVCPSVDKTKEEKPLDKQRAWLEFSILATFGILLYVLTQFMSWLGACYILMFSGFVMIVGAIGLVWTIIKLTKTTIACIKSYWRKAKEECE